MIRKLVLWMAATYCKVSSCGHARNQHSRNGCTSCACAVKYMDQGMFS